MEKSRFMNFIFAFCPGAGQMYMGMMKKGTVLMGIFSFTMIIIINFSIEVLLCLPPVIWFYSFFDTLNAKGMTKEERQIKDDLFITNLMHIFNMKEEYYKKLLGNHRILGGILVAIGAVWLIRMGVFGLSYSLYQISPWIGEIFQSFYRTIPSLIVAVGILYLGIRLLRAEDGSIPTQVKKITVNTDTQTGEAKE